MEVLRTPESRFVGLRDFPFAEHYHQVTPELRLHYVDEGPADAPPVLMLHGEPTWSYLYRHMITPVANAGLRALAPDLIGFGKSDKPAVGSDYSYAGQVAWSPWFPIGRIVQTGTKRTLSAAEIAAYEAPFPGNAYKAAARAYPSLVPMEANVPDVAENQRAWAVFEQWQKPFVCCFSNGDPITRGGDAQFRQRVPGAEGQPHTTLRGGHFIQEDDPQTFAALAIEACGHI